MRSGTVRITSGYLHRRALWNTIIGSGFFAFLLGGYLYTSVGWSMEHRGLDLGTALMADTIRNALIAAVVSWAVLIASIVYLLAGLPRRRARQEVRVDRDGVELRAEPRLWYRGTRTLVRWEDIQMIGARHAIALERRHKSTLRVSREVLDLYVFRDVGPLPRFASSMAVTGPPLEGVETPAWRVRVGGGPGEELAASVRDVAAEVGAVRPDLFYRGVTVDQWYTPTER